MNDKDGYTFIPLREELNRARDKHGWDQTPLNPKMTESEKLVILVEELGEVARAMTYDEGSNEALRAELLQTAAMAYAWFLSYIPEEG